MGARLAGTITSRVGAIVILLLAAGVSALVFATSPAQPAAGPEDGLPTGKQSTEVTRLLAEFPSGRTESGVVVYERDRALDDEDRAALENLGEQLKGQALGGTLGPTVFSEDGRAALLVVPLPGDLSDDELTETVDGLRDTLAAADLPAGATVQLTGSAAIGRDIAQAFDGADTTLLFATAGVVAVLLLLTYRSPVLWIVPLAVIGLGDQLMAKLQPWVARLAGEPTEGQVSGIVSVLVFGAGTNYALLLISRYREELRRTEDRRAAMAQALRGAAPAVLASASTVILALLMLLFALLTGNRTLGAAAAIGVGVAVVFGLVVLPAALASLPRGLFWPFVPRAGQDGGDPAEHGVWGAVARFVGRRPVAVLAFAVVVLGVCAGGLSQLRLGLTESELFRTEVESITAQETLARHFPAGSSRPLVLIAPAGSVDAVAAAVGGVDGVVVTGRPELSDDGSLAQLQVQIDAEPGTAAADDAVTAIRSAATDAASDALLGGAAAADLDERDANQRDDAVVAPLVLAVVLLVLLVLLRSLVAPVLLVLTVVASYAAALGAATVVLDLVLGIQGLAPGVPLLGFLFLVALGVDYNIFLVTRAREEGAATGSTRQGMLRALAVTGGVITSAGILLAAVFTVLGVLPIIVLTQIGVLVGIGVLLDTLLVRTLVVPAIVLLLGDRFWWPASLPRESRRT